VERQRDPEFLARASEDDAKHPLTSQIVGGQLVKFAGKGGGCGAVPGKEKSKQTLKGREQRREDIKHIYLGRDEKISCTEKTKGFIG